MSTSEAFSRVKIDALLKDVGWKLTDGRSVRFEHTVADGTRIDYVLADRQGRALAVLEAKRASVNLGEAEGQAIGYAKALGVPFVFVSNGEETRFLDSDSDAHFRPIATLYSQADLEQRTALRSVRIDPTSIAIDARVAGRPYQRDCIDVLTRAFAQGRRKMLVEMATGTGKTRTAAGFIKRLFDANAVTRALFLVDRTTLAKQTEDAFVEHIRDIPVQRITGGGRQLPTSNGIVICTLQTMINDYRRYSAGYFDLVIADECHRSIYGEFRRVLDHFDAVKIGLTATPLVGQQDDPDDEDRLAVRDTLRFFEVTEPTFRYTLREAIDEGFLVPYRIYQAQTVRTAAREGFEVRRDEIDWAALDPETRTRFEEAFAGGNSLVVAPTDLERAFTIPERNRAMVREFRDVLDKGYTGADGQRRVPARGKTIVFAVNKRHAETLARMFDDAFADQKPHPTIRYADFVVSGMDTEDTAGADAIIKRFTREAFPQILVSVNMLDTGFDCPEVVNLVMARFTRSGVLYRQMRGRGTRRCDPIKKTTFTMFDFVGNCALHDDEEGALPGEAIVVSAPAPPSERPRTTLVLDVHDEIDPATRAWLVFEQGSEAGTPTATEARAEYLGVLFERFLASETLSVEQMRLARQIGSQLRANAETITSFTASRFARGSFQQQGGLAHARALFGGAEALDAFLARLNQAVFAEGADGASPGDSPAAH